MGPGVVSRGDNIIDPDSESKASGESDLGEEEPISDSKGKGPGSDTCMKAPPASSMERFSGLSVSGGGGQGSRCPCHPGRVAQLWGVLVHLVSGPQ